MTRLLVSVRSIAEALAAAECRVDLIDVKEPHRGPLGMARATVRRVIGARLGEHYPLSAACGELLKWKMSRMLSAHEVAAWQGYRYAKIGLAGCAADRGWRGKWRAWRGQLPREIEPVLVSYADSSVARAPHWEELLAFAQAEQVRMVLFDTWDKRGSSLSELWRTADFLRVGQELRSRQIKFVLAGKLRLEHLAQLRTFGAAFVGVRGAVCDSEPAIAATSRTGKLNSNKIAAWQRALGSFDHEAGHQIAAINK